MPLVCRIELNKTDGITVTVDNADGKVLQTMLFNGTSITTTVANKDDAANKSTIVQDKDSITITCKTYKVEAETITQKSTKATLHESEDTFDVKSTKDTTITSSQKIVLTATGDVEVSGMNGSFSGKTNLTLEGKTQAEMKGGMAKVSATGNLDLEGKMTSLKGTMVKIG